MVIEPEIMCRKVLFYDCDMLCMSFGKQIRDWISSILLCLVTNLLKQDDCDMYIVLFAILKYDICSWHLSSCGGYYSGLTGHPHHRFHHQSRHLFSLHCRSHNSAPRYPSCSTAPNQQHPYWRWQPSRRPSNQRDLVATLANC